MDRRSFVAYSRSIHGARSSERDVTRSSRVCSSNRSSTLPPSVHEANGFEITFLIMLVSLVAAGVLMARARVTYASDVATAAASEERARASRPARVAPAAT